jgi:outer membrane protein TolC
MKNISLIRCLFAGLFLISAATVNGQVLTLDAYKQQVQGSDVGWKSVEAEKRGSQLLQTEAEGLTGILLTSQATFLNDKRPTTNPGFQGSKTENTGFLIGLKQQTEWGLQWALTQNFTHTQIYGASQSTLPVPKFYDAYPKLELSIPLWRNFLGAEISNQQEQMSQQSLARKKQAELAWLQKQIEIETTYYSLLAQRQLIEIQKDSIARADRILQWTKSRISKNLADSSDIYQSQAAVAARKMELLNAQKNLADAISKFNLLRGQNASELTETLEAPEVNPTLLKLSQTPIKNRRDVELKKLQNITNDSSHRVQMEKHKPQLDLSVSTALYGRDTELSKAQSKVFTDDKDYLLVALTFNMPLNQFKESDYREGYAQLSAGQKLAIEDRQKEQQLLWSNTVEQAHQLEQQLTVAQELESLQQKKANAERDKFNRGRSTLFQVLSYEQDYFNARSQRINLELGVRQFLSQLSLFE